MVVIPVINIFMERQIKLNITADIFELREFYSIIKTNFLDRRWVATEQAHHIKRSAYNDPNINLLKMPSGWALTTYLKNDDQICAPWNVLTDDFTDGTKRTNMVFGIAERLLEKIPMAYRLGISVTPGGNYIESHVDDAWHIHFPIYSPPKSFFTWDDSNRNPVDWEHYEDDGSAWALNTQLMHSVKNLDVDDRVHMFFSVKEADMPELLKIQGAI
jgi:hypothetical protein